MMAVGMRDGERGNSRQTMRKVAKAKVGMLCVLFGGNFSSIEVERRNLFGTMGV